MTLKLLRGFMVFLPHWPKFKEVQAGKINLDQIAALLSVLDNPHKKLPPTIHVTGTNGKGSTIAFMRAILEAAGFKVHVYTSPHLERFNERIVIAGSEISDSYLFSILEECRIAVEKNNIDISFFEATTAAAFLAFSRNVADVVLLEVGLGGRLDATNIIDNPAICVITPISFDHMAFLGNTLAKIAYEKACIIKQNVPCVVSMQTDEVHEVIESYAASKNAKLIRFEYDFGVSILRDGRLSYKSYDLSIMAPSPSLGGHHQYVNAATAIAAISNLKGFKISEQNIKDGISNAKWKGRIQKVNHGRLKDLFPEQWEIILDGAHNEAGAQSFAAWLQDQTSIKTYLIIGMTRNRDIGRFISYFKGYVDRIICVSVHSEPLSYRAQDMIHWISDEDIKKITTIQEDINEAFSEILRLEEGGEKIRVLVTGSLFLVADFLVANKN